VRHHLRHYQLFKTLYSACELYEQTVPCGTHSYCSETDGVASCSCEDGYEEVPDDDEHANNECQRIDPCNSVTCNTANSVCALNGNDAACTCDNNFTPYKLTGVTYIEESSLFFASDASDMVCAPTVPCQENTCNSANNKGRVQAYLKG
jgi:hypothetical protein